MNIYELCGGEHLHVVILTGYAVCSLHQQSPKQATHRVTPTMVGVSRQPRGRGWRCVLHAKWARIQTATRGAVGMTITAQDLSGAVQNEDYTTRGAMSTLVDSCSVLQAKLHMHTCLVDVSAYALPKWPL